ncbi:MAG: DUF4177 domain-containing protein [Clostridia bacterium]|nr:DUF4177 domain-containing protein [Clostridia bacterium]
MLKVGNVYRIEDYRSIIKKRALNGWRYVGCNPYETARNRTHPRNGFDF